MKTDFKTKFFIIDYQHFCPFYFMLLTWFDLLINSNSTYCHWRVTFEQETEQLRISETKSSLEGKLLQDHGKFPDGILPEVRTVKPFYLTVLVVCSFLPYSSWGLFLWSSISALLFKRATLPALTCLKTVWAWCPGTFSVLTAFG